MQILKPTIELIPETPKEELGKGLMEMKGIATPQEKKRQLTGSLRAPRDKITHLRVYIKGLLTPATYVFIVHILYLESMGEDAVGAVEV